ncbi:MAG TPA: PIG-L family deacetylase [Streptosporangiaceae bacterium]
MPTIVAFHAHPDDEVLLTGGTLARLADEGSRVVIVVATDGLMGPAPATGGAPRLAQLRASAATLGASRVEHLGYADSGAGPVLYPDPPDRVRFARAEPAEAAERLASVIREERADLLVSYDSQGGYGHPDHVRVHQVGDLAAKLTGVRVVYATIPREPARLLVRLAMLLRLLVRHDPLYRYGTPRAEITHRVNVRRYAAQKRAALAAHHAYLQSSGRSARLARALTALPAPLFGLALGREWFAEPGASVTAVSGDLLTPAPRGPA